MTIPSIAVPQDERGNFDIGPLSWVLGEVREAFARSRAALFEAVAQEGDSQSTALRQAKTHLHQAHGALQIVDVDGVVVITEAIEDLLDHLCSGQLALNHETAQVIDSAYLALAEYLEELLTGAPQQPVYLFPYYRDLLQVSGAERIHPSDLFFPNLALRPQLPSVEVADAAAPAEYTALRQRFERALLPFLKSTDRAAELAHATAMHDVIRDVARVQGNPQARGFWAVLQGLAEAVSAGLVPSERYVKQLFALINLQIRRLSEGSPSVAERLLRDALFFIACAENPTPHLLDIRKAYQLDGVVPADYEQKRYGQVDVDALATAKDRLMHAKNTWNRIAGGDASTAGAFEQGIRELTEAGIKLNSSPLSTLLHALNDIARHAAQTNSSDTLNLEMATALLFVENALTRIGHLPDSFADHAVALSARLAAIVSGTPPAQPAPWLDSMSREAQQRQTMAVLSDEMQSSLRQVEKMLDDYFNDPVDPAKRTALTHIDAILHQIGGALTVLEHDDAVRAVQHTQAAVRRFAAAEGEPEPQEFQHVARNVGALSFFIETLQLQSGGAQRRFAFDDKQGIFHANLLSKNAVPELAPASDTTAAEPIELAFDHLAPPTVEADLAYHQQQSAELAFSLSEQPRNPLLHDQLKESLEQVRLDAALVDNQDANERAQAAIDILDRADFNTAPHSLADIVNATVPVHVPDEPAAMPVAPETDEAIDAELRDIFLSEAEEVLACVRQTIPESRSDPFNQDHLTTLRRSFHTLKGSSRMVGLVAFGEAAWSIERVLNVRLAETRPGDADLYALLDKAVDVLGEWELDIKAHGRSDCTPVALAAAAERVKLGGSFLFEEVVPAAQTSDVPAAPAFDARTDGGFETVQIETEPGSAAAEFRLTDADLAALGQSGDAGALAVQLEESPTQGANVVEFPTPQPDMEHDARRALDDNFKRIGDIEISLPLHNIYLAETDELVRLLSQDIAEWRHESDRHVNVHAVHAAHSLAGSSATVGFKSLQEIAHALEAALQYLARNPTRLTPQEYDSLEHGVERIRFMLQLFALGEMPDPEPEQVERLERLPLEIQARVDAAQAAALAPAVQQIPLSHDVAADELPGDSAVAVEPMAGAPFVEPIYAGARDAAADPALALQDELDPDLLPVFQEEGRDMLPQIGQALRAWQQDATDSGYPQALLRLLHTVKGSARMAGAMALGQHMHEMETRIEHIMRSGVPTAFMLEDLLARHDHGLQLFEKLLAPLPTPADQAMAETPNAMFEQPRDHAELPTLMPSPAARLTGPVAPLQIRAPSSAIAAPLVRVRADILDRLVNQAGEVSISRSKLETEVGTLRVSLTELTENVMRLRDQLRELEMQAETQMTSRMGHSAEREFDPLEFDRFTRLQELTRMMAESVNDVGSVQQNLARTVDSASSDLTMQARLTRELQQDLMRVRMVQFASISERLYRVTRQTAKEVDKRVNLDIRGSAVEIDRSVLERMVGPFEHLLRNAIVHGIESREARHAAGKNDTGELLVEIRQEGNEVVIQFSDDGQGLNLPRIRDKAKAAGLLPDDLAATDADVTDLIFHPGFSTADEITELAGRGVGMDVVRSEAAALGGRVATTSEHGKGTHFTIHLPLTLAVTQVVILTTGGKIYAVPSVLVEQVQQLKTTALATAYNDGAVMWQGHRVPMHFLSALLGDKVAVPVAQHYSPLMIIRSDNDRTAIHVDEILGNREVVVKNIGPQLARMAGIAGATVLGSGEIVLILNPVQLAQRLAHESVRAPRILPSDAPHAMGAVAEMAPHASFAEKAAPVQGLRTQHIVMVIDDSLTVRRVTQRLLAREGYQVVLAKDGVDALEHLQSITPDVMLVDIEMPRMDGFDLLRNVRSDERTRHIPIIMITSRTAIKHRNYAMELGVDAYFGKPYQEDALLKSIAGFIDKELPVA